LDCQHHQLLCDRLVRAPLARDPGQEQGAPLRDPCAGQLALHTPDLVAGARSCRTTSSERSLGTPAPGATHICNEGSSGTPAYGYSPRTRNPCLQRVILRDPCAWRFPAHAQPMFVASDPPGPLRISILSVRVRNTRPCATNSTCPPGPLGTYM
jgi:hypothetical protein